jgi:catechol 2,3-dioxygenase
MSELIHPAAKIGAVHLITADLERQVVFYQSTLGLKILQQNDQTASLGASVADQPLIVLAEVPSARRARRATGLYHLAIRLPSRLELARTLAHLADTDAAFEGMANHGVSESLYLHDPDNNGIEIYCDRPMDDWLHGAQGQLKMDTLPLDLDNLMEELAVDDHLWDGLHPQTDIGHVHLRVGQLNEAQQFYQQILGLTLTQHMASGAAFLAAGNYHHHVGINTWLGAGTPPPPPDSIGLRWFELCLPDQAECDKVADRVRIAGLALEEAVGGLLVRDPSRNGMLLTC